MVCVYFSSINGKKEILKMCTKGILAIALFLRQIKKTEEKNYVLLEE
jgi:hypothetical protein